MVLPQKLVYKFYTKLIRLVNSRKYSKNKNGLFYENYLGFYKWARSFALLESGWLNPVLVDFIKLYIEFHYAPDYPDV